MKSHEHTELDALISLMDEPNEEIYLTIQKKIYSYGPAAIPLLENAWDSSFDHLLQQRIAEAIHAIQFDEIKVRMKSWKENNAHDLLEGFMLVTKYQYPDMDEDKIIKKVGRISQDVWLEVNNKLTGLEKIKVINHILYDVHKFTGNKVNISSVENYYLKNLLESKKGTPLSIGILYIIIAQGLNIPVHGVNLPKHFVLAYIDELYARHEKKPGSEVLFYINPFNRGAVFTKKEIELFVKQLQIKKEGAHVAPCNHVTIIKRLTQELIENYELAGNISKATELREIFNILKENP